MTDRVGSGRPAGTRPRSSKSRFRRLFPIALIFLLGGVAGYVYGQYSASGDISERSDTIRQLNAKSQELAAEVTRQAEKIAKLEAGVNRMHGEMAEMEPAENTYQIDANKSIIVAKGRLTIGLIGSPTSVAATININGKQHLAVAGDVIEIGRDPSTACQVRLQSFDMFRALVTATCAKEESR